MDFQVCFSIICRVFKKWKHECRGCFLKMKRSSIREILGGGIWYRDTIETEGGTLVPFYLLCWYKPIRQTFRRFGRTLSVGKSSTGLQKSCGASLVLNRSISFWKAESKSYFLCFFSGQKTRNSPLTPMTTPMIAKGRKKSLKTV